MCVLGVRPTKLCFTSFIATIMTIGVGKTVPFQIGCNTLMLELLSSSYELYEV